MATAQDVVVIGGGFAGLSAGVALAERGYRVTLVEKRARLGGRASSFVDPTTGEVVDNGQHVFLRAYQQTIRFLTTIGTLDRLVFQDRLRLVLAEPGHPITRISTPLLPAPFHLAAGVLAARGIPMRDRLAALAFGARLFRGTPAPDGFTVDQWLEREGQPPAVRARLWRPLALATLNEDPAVAAAGLFATVLKDAFFRRASWSAIGIPRTGLSALYTDAAQEYIERRGGRVLTGCSAVGLTVGRGRVTGVALGDGETLAASWYVCAVPYVNLPELLPSEIQLGYIAFLATRGLVSSPIISIYLWFDRPILEEPFIGMVGTAWQWAFDRRTLLGHSPSDGHIALVMSAAGGYLSHSTDELLALAIKELEAVFPASRGATLRHRVLVKEPHATFSPTVGSEAYRPDQRTPLGNFFLAGDWTRTGLPASIEGAVRSGYRCAEMIATS